MKKTENMFGFGGSFVGTVEKIFDIMALGFLWILCSLPVITIGASTTAPVSYTHLTLPTILRV